MKLKFIPVVVLILFCIFSFLFLWAKSGNAAATYTAVASTSPATVSNGSSIAFNYSVNSSEASIALVDLEVYDSTGNLIYQDYSDNQNFSAGEPKNYTSNWTIPNDLAGGNYYVEIGIFGANWNGLFFWNSDAAVFTVSSITSNPNFTISSSVNPSQVSPGDSINLNTAITSDSVIDTLIDISVEE